MRWRIRSRAGWSLLSTTCIFRQCPSSSLLFLLSPQCDYSTVANTPTLRDSCMEWISLAVQDSASIPAPHQEAGSELGTIPGLELFFFLRREHVSFFPTAPRGDNKYNPKPKNTLETKPHFWQFWRFFFADTNKNLCFFYTHKIIWIHLRFPYKWLSS